MNTMMINGRGGVGVRARRSLAAATAPAVCTVRETSFTSAQRSSCFLEWRRAGKEVESLLRISSQRESVARQRSGACVSAGGAAANHCALHLQEQLRRDSNASTLPCQRPVGQERPQGLHGGSQVAVATHDRDRVELLGRAELLMYKQRLVLAAVLTFNSTVV